MQKLNISYKNILDRFVGYIPLKKDPPPEKFRFCEIDGRCEEVANFAVEPPAIFVGRGNHPKRGEIKRRICPRDVTINVSVSKSSDLPKPNIGGKWGRVVCDNRSFWLASWKNGITGKTIYMYPAFSSESRIERIKKKFECARRLRSKLGVIRKSYEGMISKSGDLRSNQMGVILYLIDNHWLRVGSNKETLSGTYGITTIKKEHVRMLGKNRVELKYPGKDSIIYNNIIEVDSRVYLLLEKFLDKTGNQRDRVFNSVDSKAINTYLRGLSTCLTAKTFRTFHVSNFLFKCLDKFMSKKKISGEMDEEDKKFVFLYFVSLVDKKCNHRKSNKPETIKKKKK